MSNRGGTWTCAICGRRGIGSYGSHFAKCMERNRIADDTIADDSAEYADTRQKNDTSQGETR